MPCEIYKEQSLENYLKPILTRIRPELSLGSHTKGDLNILLHTYMQRILVVAQTLMRKSKKCTITVKDLISACKVVIPGELAKHALVEGQKAADKYLSSLSSLNNDEKKRRETHAGLIIPVSRIAHVIGYFCPEARISKFAPVFLAAVIEYLVAEIFDLAGSACVNNKKHFVTMRHVLLGNDEELSRLNATITFDGGVFPNIHSILLPKKKL